MFRAAAVVSDPSRIIKKKFYLEYRMAVGYATDSLDEDLLDFCTLEDWEKAKSTNMDLCAQMCRSVLHRVDAPGQQKQSLRCYLRFLKDSSFTKNLHRLVVCSET
jgi:hypothetical protein